MTNRVNAIAITGIKDLRDTQEPLTPIHPVYEEHPLAEANRAIMSLKRGDIRGAKVLRMNQF